MLRIISWNVLHIIHELNHVDNSIVIQNNPDECKRINDIYNKIFSLLDNNTIICLQEVPMDLLNLLIVHNDIYNIEFNKYTRLPCLKNNKTELTNGKTSELSSEVSVPTLVGRKTDELYSSVSVPTKVGRKIVNPYNNCSEHLVILYPLTYIANDVIFLEIKDSSKGYLILKLNNNITIVNVHVPTISLINERTALMNELLNVIKDDNFIIIGDFNSKKYVLKNDFLHIDKINIPDVNGYTYKGILKNNKIVYKTIDHIVLKNILYDCAFTDEDDFKLSDHKYIGIIIYDNKL